MTRPDSSASSTAATTRSGGRSTSRPASADGNLRPSTAPERSSAWASSDSRTSRRPSVSRSPIGTVAPSTPAVPLPSSRCSVSSSMKNGLPSVAAATARTSSGAATPSGDVVDERSDLGGPEPGEDDPFHRRVTAQFGEGAGVGLVLIGRADGGEDRQVGEQAVGGEVGQQGQRRRVGPVHVLEDEQRAAQPGEQHGDRLEQQPAFDAGLGDAGGIGPRRVAGQLRQQPGELAGDGRAIVATVLDDRPHRIDERLVRTEAILRATTPQDDGVIGHRGRQLADESGLADPRLAGHDHHPDPSLPRRRRDGASSSSRPTKA